MTDGKTVTECESCGNRRTLWHECCAHCGTQLTDLFTEGNRQYKNALEVILSGGYGMFFDNIDGDKRAFLCFDCGTQLCETYPWINQLVGRTRL
jgi:ribosomal protein L32